MQRVRCDVHVEFPVEGDPARRSPEFAAKVLRLTIESWKPYGAALTSSRFSRAVGGSDVLGVGWQTYFTDPRVVSIVPPGTACEPFADGVLMRLDGDTFSCSTGQVLQATVIRDALRPAGLLSLPPLDLAR
jgi:hypothetical protein